MLCKQAQFKHTPGTLRPLGPCNTTSLQTQAHRKVAQFFRGFVVSGAHAEGRRSLPACPQYAAVARPLNIRLDKLPPCLTLGAMSSRKHRKATVVPFAGLGTRQVSSDQVQYACSSCCEASSRDLDHVKPTAGHHSHIWSYDHGCYPQSHLLCLGSSFRCKY